MNLDDAQIEPPDVIRIVKTESYFAVHYKELKDGKELNHVQWFDLKGGLIGGTNLGLAIADLEDFKSVVNIDLSSKGEYVVVTWKDIRGKSKVDFFHIVKKDGQKSPEAIHLPVLFNPDPTSSPEVTVQTDKSISNVTLKRMATFLFSHLMKMMCQEINPF